MDIPDIVKGELVDIEEIFDVFTNYDREKQPVMASIADFFNEARQQIENFKNHGDFQPDLSKIKKERPTINGNYTAVTKENTQTIKAVEEEPIRRSRRGKALSEISTNTTRSGAVKLEKISEADSEKIPETVTVKEEMPPPQQPARRGRKKKITTSNDTIDSNRDSDVILQKQHIPIVNLSDSDEEDKINKIVPQEEPLETTTRSTRTKTRAQVKATEPDKCVNSESSQDSVKSTSTKPRTKKTKQTKRSLDRSSGEEDLMNSRAAKRSKSLEENVADQTYVKPTTGPQELNVTVTKPADATVVVEKGNNLTDETVVLSKAGPVIVTTPLNKRVDLNDLLTDDEDEKVVEKEEKALGARVGAKGRTGPTKPIFSTFENSPVKKRVEAFEKLKAGVEEEVPRLTRTKTKAKQQPKDQQEEVKAEKESADSSRPSKLPVVDKSRVTPQHHNRFLPATFAGSSSASKTQTALRDIILPAKSASALKACQQEFIEREVKRQKEQEALKKREALLQAKKEESKRKREEKQLKAQSARAALEKDKQRMLEEAERAKEEKYKQMMAEKNEKFARQKEEAEAKRMLAHKKAQEEKRALEAKRREEERKAFEKEKPVYLDQSAPLLPTDDCYDSDDDRRADDVNTPLWTRKENMYVLLKNIHHVGDKVKNTLFMCEATTPDLTEIFKNINPAKLKRTSSAVWRKAPRFTMMTVPNEQSIREDDDDY